MNTNSNRNHRRASLQADRSVRESAIGQAVAVCGSQTELARRCGVQQGHVWYWLRMGRVPAGHCRAVSQATNGRVSVYDLRPDIFSEAPDSQGSAHRRGAERRRGEDKATEKAKPMTDARLERIKQELGWLKVLFTVCIAIATSLTAWLAQHYPPTRLIVYSIGCGGVIVLVGILAAVLATIYDHLNEIEGK